MIAELVYLSIGGGLAGLSVAGLLALRLRRQAKVIENHNRQIYARIAPGSRPRFAADFLAQLHDGTLVLAPPSMW